MIKIYTTDEILKNYKMEDIFKTIIGIQLNDKNEIIISNEYYKKILNKKIENSSLCIERTNIGHQKIYQKLYKNIRKNYEWGNDKNTDLKKNIKEFLCTIDNSNKINQNYKFCHIWGCSRNPWLNCEYWNTWFVPYVYAELTEKNRGNFSEKFKKNFKNILLKDENIKNKIRNYNNTIYQELYNDNILKILNNMEYRTYKNEKNELKKVDIKYILNQLILINLISGDEIKLFVQKNNGVVSKNKLEDLSDYGIKKV